MTRQDFITAYVKASGLPAEAAKYAPLGFVDLEGAVLIALPCGCDLESCEGWAMVGAVNVDAHLRMSAPAYLRKAYLAATDGERKLRHLADMKELIDNAIAGDEE